MARFFWIIFFIGVAITEANAQLPTVNGYAHTPDRTLLGWGNYWDYEVKPNWEPSKLVRREPTQGESIVVQQAANVFQSSSAKAMALVSGRDVVWSAYKAPAGDGRLLNSMSIGKTIAAIATGRAICEGKITLDTFVKALIPELAETAIGSAKVRHLLTMSSGTWEGNPDSTITDSIQASKIFVSGEISWLDVLMDSRVTQAHSGILGKRKPGEYFAYRGTDPLVLGVMLTRATGVGYAEWVEREILIPAGIEWPAKISRDRIKGYGQSDSGVRMRLDDWIRFAVWVFERSQEDDCLGQFLREGASQQIENRSKKFGSSFDGYGYLIWTNNRYAPKSYWAVGYGGQRIGWASGVGKIIVVFSNTEDYMLDVYRVFAVWSKISQQ
ncbi:serine hydrolase domain-containing protein [Hydrogenophaga defluvii]|uniref:Serine hydrolase domain-containing protein n=1 Tax=Hydrogenophaga defluvii TaxID=249410 RepID=A0ABW2SCN6_9BURK